MPVVNGSHYIQKSNQDYWLKIGTPGQTDGVWTRMGNIRDDGASGIVSIKPIVDMGLYSSSPAIQRIRYLSPPSQNLGFSEAANNFTIFLSAASMQMGYSQANALTMVAPMFLSASMSYGTTETVSLASTLQLSATFGYGYNMAATIFESLAASMAYGFGMAASLQISQLFINLTYQLQTPSTIGGTFTYTGTQNGNTAAQAHLADGTAGTYAADPAGLTASTAASYDFGSAVNIAKIVATSAPNANLQGWSATAAMDIQYSDTSLTAGWTSTNQTITITGGAIGQTSSISNNEGLASGAPHRYWRIINDISGATGMNAWLDELDMSVFNGYRYGFDMAVALSLMNAPQIPVAVNTSFTYTGGGAAEAHLYDGVSGTYAADPNGENSTTPTHASYDLGSAKTITGVRIVTANANGGWTNNMTLAINYSDTGLTGPWTSSGSTITVTAGLGTSQTVTGISAGSHRYWQVTYQSGTVVGANAWTDEIAFLA